MVRLATSLLLGKQASVLGCLALAEPALFPDWILLIVIDGAQVTKIERKLQPRRGLLWADAKIVRGRLGHVAAATMPHSRCPAESLSLGRTFRIKAKIIAGDSRGVLQCLQPRLSQQSDGEQSAGEPRLYDHDSDSRPAKQCDGRGWDEHLSGRVHLAFRIRGHQLYRVADAAQEWTDRRAIYILIPEFRRQTQASSAA